MSEQQVSSEQAADLAALQAQAAGENQAPHLQTEQAQSVDLAKEISSMAVIVITTLKPMLPSLGDIYTEQTIQTAAGAIAGVCKKHNWLEGGMMGEWGEEIAAAVILVPLAIATSAGIKMDIKRAKEKTQNKQIQEQNTNTTLSSPEQKSVIIGSPAVE